MKIRLPMNPLIATSLVVMLYASAALPSMAAESGVKADQIIIGQTLSLQGGRDADAVALGQGVKLYLDATNNSGGVAGRKISLRVLDDAAQPATAEFNSLQLISGGVFALLGSNNMATHLASAKVANDFRVPVFAVAARSNSKPVGTVGVKPNAIHLGAVATPGQPVARSAQLLKEFESLAGKASPPVAMTVASLDGFEAAKAMVVALKTLGDPPTRAKLGKIMVASGLPSMPSLAGRSAPPVLAAAPTVGVHLAARAQTTH